MQGSKHWDLCGWYVIVLGLFARCIKIEVELPLINYHYCLLCTIQEKGYRDYGHDIDNTDTIVEAGLSFTCDFDKGGDGFIGMEHVLAQKALAKEHGGMSRRMAQVLVEGLAEDPSAPLLYHGEVLWRNGERISDIRSASYGHTVGGGVGLTMLESPTGEAIKKAYLEGGEWELEIGDKMYPCKVSFAPLYDSKNTRIKM
jgi:glycine cleavage system aminomethyltransferase T